MEVEISMQMAREIGMYATIQSRVRHARSTDYAVATIWSSDVTKRNEKRKYKVGTEIRKIQVGRTSAWPASGKLGIVG